MEPLDNKTKKLLDAVSVLIVLSIVMVLFLRVFLSVFWHYLLCAWCMVGCIFCLMRGSQKGATAAAVIMTLVAMFGFFSVYETAFKDLCESFTDYLTKYGVFSLPVFLFPAVGLMLMSKVNEKKENKLKGNRHGKL